MNDKTLVTKEDVISAVKDFFGDYVEQACNAQRYNKKAEEEFPVRYEITEFIGSSDTINAFDNYINRPPVDINIDTLFDILQQSITAVNNNLYFINADASLSTELPHEIHVLKTAYLDNRQQEEPEENTSQSVHFLSRESGDISNQDIYTFVCERYDEYKAKVASHNRKCKVGTEGATRWDAIWSDAQYDEAITHFEDMRTEFVKTPDEIPPVMFIEALHDAVKSFKRISLDKAGIEISLSNNTQWNTIKIAARNNSLRTVEVPDYSTPLSSVPSSEIPADNASASTSPEKEHPGKH